jgi:hypothetical protein
MSYIIVIAVFITACPERSFQSDHLTFAEVPRNKFSCLPPSYAGDKICIILACLLILILAVDCDCETA